MMTQFIKLDTAMPNHPKIADLSDKAFRLLIELWCYCHLANNDGVLSEREFKRQGTPAGRRELEQKSLVYIGKGVVSLHDYLQHQQSKEDRLTLSEKRRKVGAAGGRAKAEQAKRRAEQAAEDPQQGYQIAKQNAYQNPGKSLAEVEVEEEKTHGPTMGAAPVLDGRDSGPAPSGPGSVDAHALVRNRIGDHITIGTRNSLGFEVQKLRAEHIDDDTINAALDRWDARTGVTPRLLPSLVDDIRKEARGATSRPPLVTGSSPTDAFAEQFLRGPQPPALRAITGGNA